MKLLKSALLAAVVTAAASAQAVTVFQPESTIAPCGCDDNENVDVTKTFIDLSVFGLQGTVDSLPSGTVYLFDNDVESYSTQGGLALTLGKNIEFNVADQTVFVHHNGQSLSIFDDASFILVLNDNGTWIEDTGFEFTGDENGKLYFGNSATWVNVNDVQEVPVPAAAWLFGSAILGLTGVSRRKKAA